MEGFVHDTILQKENICNLEVEQEKLKSGVKKGAKLLVFGKRNTGKTSVLESVVIPYFRKEFHPSFVLSADFLGVHSIEEISRRLVRSFERALAKSFPTRSAIHKIMGVLRGINPSITANQDGSFSFSISGWNDVRKPVALEDVFEQIRRLENNHIPILITFDEFQDIEFVKSAPGIIRNELQHLSSKTPVIVLGSKKHILNRLFAAHHAPFFNWGTPVEFHVINYETYARYMQKRFQLRKISIELEASKYLQDLVQRIPEPINILCNELFNTCAPGTNIQKTDIELALKRVLEARRSKMEEYLSFFSSNEVQLLTALAKEGNVISPTGKDFLTKVSISKAGVQKIIKKFLDHAILYKESDYHLADPLLKQHLIMFH